jgi:hypothetical protein
MDYRVHQYLRQLRRFLYLPRKEQKTLLEGISAELNDYIEAHPESTQKQLAAAIGEPKAMARQLLEDAGRWTDLPKRRWKRLALGILVAALLLVIAYLCHKVAIMRQETEGVIVETITVYDVREDRDSSTTESN